MRTLQCGAVGKGLPFAERASRFDSLHIRSLSRSSIPPFYDSQLVHSSIFPYAYLIILAHES